MNFEQYLDQAWQNHSRQPHQVVKTFSTGLELVEKPEQISSLVRLMTHVMGEHLGLWSRAVENLQKLKSHTLVNSEISKFIDINIEALKLASGVHLSDSLTQDSERIQAKAIAASALVDRDTERAFQLFEKAVEMAKEGISDNDPACRALAVMGNNLATALEEKPTRSMLEDELMVLAAQTSRKFWEKTGNWLNVERAEYRLANSCLKAGLLPLALKHSENCLEICKQNSADPLEFFFGYEALAKVEKARENQAGFKAALDQMNFYFQQLPDEDKSWSEKALNAFSHS